MTEWLSNNFDKNEHLKNQEKQWEAKVEKMKMKFEQKQELMVQRELAHVEEAEEQLQKLKSLQDTNTKLQSKLSLLDQDNSQLKKKIKNLTKYLEDKKCQLFQSQESIQLLTSQVQDLSHETQGLFRDKKKKQRKIEDLISLYTDTRQKLSKTLQVLGIETEEEDKSVCQ